MMSKEILFSQIKVKSIDFFIFFYLILMAGNGSKWFDGFNVWGLLILFIMLIWLSRHVTVQKIGIGIVLLGVAVLSWIFLHYIKDSDFRYFDYFRFAFYVLFGFFVTRYYGLAIPVYFSKSIYILSLISLPFWLFINLFGTSLLKYFTFAKGMHASIGSFVVYNVPDLDFYTRSSQTFMGLIRNPGFCWEPGKFASLIVLGIFFYILAQGRNFKFADRRFLIMLFALLTTISTTGYVALLVVLGIHLFVGGRMGKIVRIVLILSFSLISVFIMSLPFMQQKIEEQMNTNSFFSEDVEHLNWLNNDKTYFTAARFEGMALDVLNIKHDPLLGFGLSIEESYVNKTITPWVITSNGLTKPLAQLGLLFGVPFFLCFLLSSKKLVSQYKYPFSHSLAIVLVLLSVSYNHFFNPIFFAIIFYIIFNNKSLKCV